jgi:hypothetical protein
VSRLLFFILLIGAIAFGFHLWLASATEKVDYSTREKNRDDVRIVAVTTPAIAAKNAEEARRAVQSLAGAACVEFSGIGGADIARAREAFAALQLGSRLQ